jgi:hypothetical protein
VRQTVFACMWCFCCARCFYLLPVIRPFYHTCFDMQTLLCACVAAGTMRASRFAQAAPAA